MLYSFNDLFRIFTTDSNGNGAGSVVAELKQVTANPQIIPKISGTSSSYKDFNNTNGNDFAAVLLATGGAAMDTVTLNTRLSNRFPEVSMLPPGGIYQLSSSSAITRVQVVGLGAIDSTGNNMIATGTTLLATIATAALEYTFDEADDVKVVEISLSPTYLVGAGGTTVEVAGQKCIMTIVGYKA